MKKHLNNPDVSRKYNYVYKLTNKINGKIYFGVHRTDNIDDNYMGSGLLLKRAQNKYGIENFEKEIIEEFDTYKEALQREREIVTTEFIEESTNYNIREGGYGNCKWSTQFISKLSESAKKKWENPKYRKMMEEKVYSNSERNQKVGEGRSKWIKNNPEQHKKNMDKINHNPEKIQKMAETHTGMKRSDIAKKNISKGIKDYYSNSKDGGASRSGKGCIYIHNPETGEAKRIQKIEKIPSGWKQGIGKRKNGRC